MKTAREMLGQAHEEISGGKKRKEIENYVGFIKKEIYARMLSKQDDYDIHIESLNHVPEIKSILEKDGFECSYKTTFAYFCDHRYLSISWEHLK